jgi:hypothetical protein
MSTQAFCNGRLQFARPLSGGEVLMGWLRSCLVISKPWKVESFGLGCLLWIPLCILFLLFNSIMQLNTLFLEWMNGCYQIHRAI